MPLTGAETTEDLDEVEFNVAAHTDPRRVTTNLVAAVDEKRHADDGDTAYALGLAAEILANHGDIDQR
jgi:hypothetical protein